MSFESGLARRGPLSVLAFAALLLGSRGAWTAESRACGPSSQASEPGATEAAPRLDVQHGPGFALVRGAESYAAGACAPGHISRPLLKELAESVSRSLDVDPALAVVLVSAPVSCSSIYYAALANDVRGIGYAHTDAREIFDDTPDSALEGVVFLNDWPYWRERPDELRGAFDHEVGHRWGARVHARLAGEAASALLGREDQHWSYLLETSGSPLEGNVWASTNEGFETQTPAYPTRFSALDLYLMGAVAPSEVPPFQLLTGATFATQDCRGQPISPASPPQSCGSARARATAIQVSIDAILAAEGPREPAASGAVQSVRVLPIVLDVEAAGLAADTCAELSNAVATRLAEFEVASSGYLRLENVLGPGEACEAVCSPHADAGVEVATCAIRPPQTRRGSWTVLLLMALVVYRRRG